MSRILEMLADLQSSRMKSEPPVAAVQENRGLPRASSFVDYYRLQRNPFADALDLDFFFKTASQEAAFQRLRATVTDKISLGLLSGPSGSGKTIIAQLLLHILHRDGLEPISISVTPGMSKTSLLREMLRELGVTPPGEGARCDAMLSLLHGIIMDLHREERRLVALIDEAHFLSSEALHVLRTLSNIEAPGEKLCTCLLFAEERFRRRLSHPSHHSLATRLFHRISLAPMSIEETVEYIRYRLLVAGGAEWLINDEACQSIAARSGGICRETNRLAYLALNEACLQRRGFVTADMVEAN